MREPGFRAVRSHRALRNRLFRSVHSHPEPRRPSLRGGGRVSCGQAPRRRGAGSEVLMPRLTKIYTKTGDDGTTGLGSGQRVPKESPRIEAYGTVDELNSQIGVALAAGLNDTIAGELSRIQNELFHLGSDLCILEEDKLRLPVPEIGRTTSPRSRSSWTAFGVLAAPRQLHPARGNARRRGAARRAHHLPPSRAARRGALAPGENRGARRGVLEPALRRPVRHGPAREPAPRRAGRPLEQPGVEDCRGASGRVGGLPPALPPERREPDRRNHGERVGQQVPDLPVGAEDLRRVVDRLRVGQETRFGELVHAVEQKLHEKDREKYGGDVQERRVSRDPRLLCPACASSPGLSPGRPAAATLGRLGRPCSSPPFRRSGSRRRWRRPCAAGRSSARWRTSGATAQFVCRTMTSHGVFPVPAPSSHGWLFATCSTLWRPQAQRYSPRAASPSISSPSGRCSADLGHGNERSHRRMRRSGGGMGIRDSSLVDQRQSPSGCSTSSCVGARGAEAQSPSCVITRLRVESS